MHLTAKQIETLRQGLERERQALLDKMAENTAEVTADVNDIGDLAVEDVSQELMWELEERRADRLMEIEEMLRRMEDGSYGICEKCGEGIPFKRLQAMPAARRCIACQEQEEKNAPMARPEEFGVWPMRWAM